MIQIEVQKSNWNLKLLQNLTAAAAVVVVVDGCLNFLCGCEENMEGKSKKQKIYVED